jgi:hypothetical protein
VEPPRLCLPCASFELAGSVKEILIIPDNSRDKKVLIGTTLSPK